MRKLSTFLLHFPELILKAFIILFCFFNSAETFAQVITPPNIFISAPSTTTLSSSANPSLSGQPVVITATVTSPASGFPTGTVHFFDNATNTDLTPSGVAMLNGIATYTTPPLTAGVMSISATYSGDAGNLASTSAAFTQTVNNPIIIINGTFNTTTTTLVSNLNPSIAGSQAVTLTATVTSSGSANLTGNVIFFDNTNNKNLTPGGVAVSNGVATFTTSSLDFGDLNITATYSGDANGNQQSTSNPLIQHVMLNITGIGVTLTSSSSGNTSVWGADVTFTATVSTGVGGAAGTVVFADNGYFLGSATIDGSSKAALKTDLLTPGSHNVTASFFSITSSVLTQNVTPGYHTIFVGQGTGDNHSNVGIISSAKTTIEYGREITFAVNVLGDGINIPTGNISFKDGSDPENPILLETVGLDVTGNCTFTTSILSLGTHKIYAVYSGNDIYLEDSSTISHQYNTKTNSYYDYVTPVIVKASTTTTVSSSLNPSVAGQQITFIARVPAPFPSDAIPPTGTVTYTIDGVDQNPVPLLTGNGGKAFLDISSLSPGSHTIKATYPGDGNYGGSSASITQVVEAVGSAIFNFIGSSQTTAVNTFFPNSLQFDIININPKLTSGAVVTFTAPSSGASGTFSNGTNTITVHTTPLSSVGVADSGPFKANGIGGTYTVIATIPGMGTDEFTLTNVAPAVSITVGTSVQGLSFTVDGATFTSAHTFNWIPGSSHSIATTSTQAGAAGTQYVFTGWSDGTNTLTDNITVPANATSYTANFNTQYQLTTAASPSNGGTVFPAISTFYNSGDVVSLTATPGTGYQFNSWTGTVANANAASTSITMNAPKNVTANFDQLSVTFQVTIGTSVPGLSFTVDGTTYTSTQHLNWFPGDIHGISTSTTQAGAAGTQYVFTDWNGTGDASKLVSAGASTTYTANFKTQYQLTTISNPVPGSSGSITPISGNFYDAASLIVVQANADAGSVFSGFTGDLTGTSNPQNLTLDGPKTVTAGFDCQPSTWYKDADNDLYSDGTTQTQCTRPANYKLASELTATSGDCDDANAAIKPTTVWYKDADNDLYSDGTIQTQCARPANYKLASELTATSGDCDDANAAIKPTTVWYKDGDNDLYSDGTIQTQCARPANYKLASELTATSGDCDDANAAIKPTTVWYKDADNDLYSDGTTQTQCARPANYKLASELTATTGDCNDANAAIKPTTVWYKDADNDLYSDGTTQTQCARPTNYKLASELTATTGDCNDANAAIKPTTVWYKDADNDLYSDGTTQTQCARPANYKLASELTATSGDCDDANAAIKPTTVWYKDADNDLYSDGTMQTQCTRPANYKLASELTAISGDCNEFDATVNPGVVLAITAPLSKSVNADAGQCSALNVSLGTASHSNNCSALTVTNNAPLSFPKGATVVIWTVTDGAGHTATASQTITVVDNEKPIITGASPDIAVLSPPNRKMRDVAINYSANDNCGNVTTSLAIKSSDAISGTGDGDLSPDWEIVDNHHVRLRAERAGTGDGRVYTVTITATDAGGNTSTSFVTVRVTHNITSPSSGQPFKVGSTVSFTGTFWDKPTNKHTANWTIDDNTIVKGSVTEPTATKNGTVTGSYKFTTPGVYKLQMNTIDQNNTTSYANTNGDLEEIIVIYDPNGGYTYGGGWFNSPVGALMSNPQATGKVSYGFSVNYYKGATLPKGESQFELKTGSFEYNALNFDYLSIAGYKAVFKGSGKIIGGQSGINFIMYVIDGDLDGTGVDKVRIKIYNKNTSEVYYDNQPGASDVANPTTPVGANSTVTISGSNSILTSAGKAVEPEVSNQLTVAAMPNPSNTNFKLVVKGSHQSTEIKMLVADMYGRIIEERMLPNEQTISLGDRYRPGTYIVKFMQGDETKQLKLIKLPN